MSIFKKKESCVHCNEKKTKRIFEDFPTCAACEIKIKMGREEKLKCPECGTEMSKHYLEDYEIIIDKCKNCDGIYLNKSELDLIVETLKDAGSSGENTGLLLGLAIGNSMGMSH